MTPNDRRKMISVAIDDQIKEFTQKTADDLERLSVLIWKDEREALILECDARVKSADDETQEMAVALATEREKTKMAQERCTRLNGLLVKVKNLSEGGGS